MYVLINFKQVREDSCIRCVVLNTTSDILIMICLILWSSKNKWTSVVHLVE